MQNTPATLITAKVHVPPRRGELLRRPRLADLLYRHIEKQLFLISAPAGYGKTSLLVDFAHEVDFPVAWYALDEFDNAPHTFLRYLLTSVRVHFPTFGTQALAALERASESIESLQPVISLTANEMYRLSDHLMIVLDDYHVIRNEMIDQLLALLIRYAGENCHLFIDSRTLPRIPDQVLLLARGKMDGLGIHELKFTPPEIQALVQQNYQLTVSERRAKELAQVTDGWITALLLMAHRVGWGELVGSATVAPEATGRVYDYLAEQVFTKQSAEMQHFMLGSSILDLLDPDLLDRLPRLGGSHRMLTLLQAEQLFVTQLGGQNEVYAYHPLFREFLRNRLRCEMPEWHAELSMASADLYAEQGRWERVVEMYLSLGKTDEAVRALERAEESLRLPSHIATVTPWLKALPQEMTPLHPHLLSLNGKIHRSRGELEQAVLCFDHAAMLFEEAGDWESAADKLELKATMLRLLGRYHESIGQSEKMDRLLDARDHPSCRRWRGISLHLRGSSEYSLGELASASVHLAQARELFESTDDLISQANVNHDLGITLRALGRLDEALEHYAGALRLWERTGNPGDAANTMNNLGNVYALQGKTAEADRILRDALIRSREAGTRRVEALVLATLGDVQRDLGDYAQSLGYYSDSLRIAQEMHEASSIFYDRLYIGDCYRRMGDYARAHQWLDAIDVERKGDASRVELGQFKLCRGLLAGDEGILDLGVALLADAARLFKESGNKHLEAVAEFHWAHALTLQARVAEAESHLRRTAQLVKELGYDFFLVVEGRRAELTLRMASQLTDVGPCFQRVLERVRPLASQFQVRSAAETAPVLTVHTLGHERFALNGIEVSSLRPQVRDLFLFLLTRYPQGARRDELWDMFWQDLSAERADGVLRITVTRIRKSLCPVPFSNGWYSLTPERIWYDVQEFEKGLADAGRAQEVSSKIARLQQALGLYCGDFCERIEHTWALVERERMRKLHLGALVSLGDAFGQTGDWQNALQTFDRARDAEPFLEEAWRGGMQAHVKMGNRAAAIAHYERLKDTLHKEMGIEPSPETLALAQQITTMAV